MVVNPTNTAGTTNATEPMDAYEIFKQLLCTADKSAGLRHQLITLATLNILLSLTAIIGNSLILFALLKAPSLHPPSKILFRSLAMADLCVGFLGQPLYVVYIISQLTEQWSICHRALVASFATGSTLGAVSLVTLTAISVDRRLALKLGMRYKQIVTLKRTYLVVITFWILSPVTTALSFVNYMLTLGGTYLVVLLCLLTSMCCYTSIFRTLRKVQFHFQNHPQGPTRFLNVGRFKMAVYGVVWIQVVLVGCYLPYGIVSALWFNMGMTSVVFPVAQYAITLVYINSSLNPFIYCWKITEVREAMKETLRQLFFSSYDE